MSVVMGDTVKIHYTGKFENGEIFDSSRDRAPFTFTMGAGHVIPGFEEAVMGMNCGENKTTVIAPEKGYGIHDENQLISMPKDSIPEGMELIEGMELTLQDEHGHYIPVVLTKVEEETITLDANHPLAGKTLVFDIELLEIGCELEDDDDCCCDDEDCDCDCDDEEKEGGCGGCCGSCH